MKHIFNRIGNTGKFVFGLALLTVLLGAGCNSIPSKHVYTEIDIEAPPGRVWAILADNESYPQWNPYHVSVEGKLEVGEKLAVVLHKPNGETVRIEPHVMRLVPERELTWGGGIKGIFHGEHVFLLEDIGAGVTRVVQKEDFSGIAIPFASLDAIEEGYRQMNQALKILVEGTLADNQGRLGVGPR